MPTNEEVARALKIISKNAANYEYFFTKVDDPSWLQPLDKHHLFDDPPSVIREGSTVDVSPWWPPSQCLARMACKAPNEVLAIALRISTDNYIVMSDLVEAALAMPVSLAARLAEKGIQWLRKGNQTRGLLDEQFGKLIAKLANEGKSDVALILAGELLAVLPDPEAAAKQQKRAEASNQLPEMAGLLATLRPNTLCDQFNYEEILKNYIPALSHVAPLETLSLLCSLLEKAVLYSNHEGEKYKPYDNSFIWRPAIEDHEQNHHASVQCLLTTAVRDTGEWICNSSPERTSEVVIKIESYEWNIFKRIGLHLLRVTTDAPVDLIRKRLLDDNLFDNLSFHHEYFHLIKTRFGRLTADEQNIILDWINKASLEDKRLNECGNDRPEEREKQVNRRRYKKLIPIQDYLTGCWKELFERLQQQYKSSEMPPDFLSYVSEAKWVSPESPKKIDELASMTLEAIIEYLKNWKPTGEWESPTPGGLGSAIGDLVAHDPERYAAEIEQFMDTGIDPTYIRYLFSGFNRILENDKTRSFPSVLKLCKWIVVQPLVIREHGFPSNLRDGIEVDRTWRNTKSEITKFIDKSFEEERHFPIELREQVWAIIRPLTDDPEPDLQHEEKYGGGNMDPMTLSINTIRGKALHTAMSYAMWVCRNIKDDLQSRENRNPSFKDIPELREVLERHLDPKADPSQTCRAVYGHWLPQLVKIDSDWVQSNLNRLFPQERELQALRDAVWHTYLLYGGNLYKATIRILLPVYRDELLRLKENDVDEGKYKSPQEQMAKHVVILYLWGELDLEEGGLIDIFFQKGSPHFTAHAIDFIGYDTREAPIDKSVFDRMKALWDWRVQKTGGYANMPDKELAAFSWWFSGGRFESEWSFQQLEEVLKRTGIDGYHAEYLLKRMSSWFFRHPKQALRCLKNFIERVTDPWFFYGKHKKEGVWTLLEQGMISEDPEIRDQAEEIVHLLGAKGHMEYRGLLKKRSPESK